MPRVARSHPVDQLIRAALRVARPAYRELVACSIEERDCPVAFEVHRVLARSLILVNLIGRARTWDVARILGVELPLLSGRPVDPVTYSATPDKFMFAHDAAVLESGMDDGLIVGEFLKAVQGFEGRVPALATTVKEVTLRARLAAAAVIAAEVDIAAGAIVGRTPGLAALLRQRFWVSGLDAAQTVDVRKLVADAVRGDFADVPTDIPVFIDRARQAGIRDLTDARLETVYRNNVNSAFNEAQADAGSDPAVVRALPLAEIDEIRDRRTRGNPNGLYPDRGFHWQMDGYVGTVVSLRARGLIPPAGHQCRGGLRLIPFAEAQERGFIDALGNVDEDAVRRHNGPREGIVARGEYPDPGWN